MTKLSTNIDEQRNTFIESLHASLKRQSQKAIKDNNKFIVVAKSYLDDGLDESECIELLMIDGINREAAEGYVSMAALNESQNYLNSEYFFKFEDSYGKIWNSLDINRTILAHNDNDAWNKIEELIDSDPSLEVQSVLSVNKIN
jgi:hypothetical protein